MYVGNSHMCISIIITDLAGILFSAFQMCTVKHLQRVSQEVKGL